MTKEHTAYSQTISLLDQIGSDRPLFDEQKLETLRAEIGPHVTRSVAFFLAAATSN